MRRVVRTPLRWRPAAARVLAMCATAVAVAGGGIAGVAGATEPEGYRFGPSGLHGGGFQNVIAVAAGTDDTGARPLVVGGDVSGYHRSTDGGLSWQAANLGVLVQNDRHIASLAFSEDPSTPAKVYSLFGNGTVGGFMVSLDGGRTWAVQSTAVKGDGGNPPAGSGLPNPHPRSTGNLIVQARAGGTVYLWVATFRDGVQRSTDDGATWPVATLGGHTLRSLVQDPSDPATLYAASWDRGVWVTHDAFGTMAFSPLPGSPPRPEELLVVGGRLYLAAGSDGVRSYDPGSGTWAQLGPAQLPAGSVWQSIAGDEDAGSGTVTLYAGCSKPEANAAGKYQSVFKSGDGGATWVAVTTSGVTTTVDGTAEAWWLAGVNRNAMLDGSTFVASQILVDPDDPLNVYVAGRSGVWRSRDGGAQWQPAVAGLGATINAGVAADPNVAGRVYLTNADWPFLASADGLRHVAGNTPKDAAVTAVDVGALALDTATTPSTVYVGTDGGGLKGEVWSNADPVVYPTWQRQGLSTATSGKHVAGLAVGRDGEARVILAAVTGGGVWRKAGGGSWSRVSPAGLTVAGGSARFAWAAGSPLVYLYDHATGVWRSPDSGRSWARLWNQPSSGGQAGYVAADPLDPNRLFVTVSHGALGGLYRFDDAGAAGDPPVAVAGFSAAAAIVADQRGLFVHQPPLSSAEPARVSFSGDGGLTFAAVSDAFYRRANQIVNALDVGPAGEVYVALQGSGVTVGVPSGAPPPPDTEAPVTGITSPAGGAALAGPLAVTASATDDVAVTLVELAVDGVVAQSSATRPYRFAWDSRLVAVGAHTLAVRAHDGAGNMAASAPVEVTVFRDTTPPAAPAGLTATAVDPAGVSFAWSVATDDVGVSGYRVLRDGVAVGTTPATTFRDETVPAGVASTYTVTAVDTSANIGPVSNALTVTVPVVDTKAPSAPKNLTATATIGQIALRWDRSSDNVGVAGYFVYRDSRKIATVTTNSHVDATVRRTTTYAYKVKAFDAAGNVSARSNVLQLRSK